MKFHRSWTHTMHFRFLIKDLFFSSEKTNFITSKSKINLTERTKKVKAATDIVYVSFLFYSFLTFYIFFRICFFHFKVSIIYFIHSVFLTILSLFCFRSNTSCLFLSLFLYLVFFFLSNVSKGISFLVSSLKWNRDASKQDIGMRFQLFIKKISTLKIVNSFVTGKMLF